ncbi:gamma-glutamyltransferase [Futiania mangrovi]|uniref:Glutathione hydrolase proenzyme n=1 Tax=Futiania mangrovi TaxID=2959716 RepID=A0A9J6PIF0_9PROT|nr:gamma-glutamyltransferase [Futiania mangrovii]MCP1336343.1 gamma-glutamyltransferase [Futiania mangrovii]
MRDLHLPGRSTVHARNGMCATSHPLAALAAVDVLRRGGNAYDAAVAASAVLCVVEPMSTGVGGDCFVLAAPGGGNRLIGLNGSGRAPRAADAAALRAEGMETISIDSIHSVTVPGAVDAWERLIAAHGTMALGDLLAPAIAHAEEGFPVSPRVARDWKLGEARLRRQAGGADVLLPGGAAPACGDIVRFPRLARTLRAIAEKGRAGFYEGEVAQSMVAFLRAHGGVHTLDDFAATEATWVEPVRTSYRGYQLAELPPNGHGVTALMMLKTLEGFDLAALDPSGADRIHLEAEAARLAFDVRDGHVADPDFAAVPMDHLLSDRLADEMRARIDMERAMTGIAPFTGPIYRDTVYVSVVDRDLNAVSFINSIYFQFGSGFADPGTGVNFQNRGAGFRLEEGHPNVLQGGKRPLHTIIPAMLMQDGRAVMCYGVMGGAYQPVGHVHVATNIVDYGMDVQEAIDHARSFHVAGRLELERGIDDHVADQLAAKGHPIGRPDNPWGGGQAIWIDHARGALIGGSDPRKDGAALGW